MKKTALIWIMVSLAVLLGSTSVLPRQSGATSSAGGQGGNPFTDPQPAAGTRVTEVRIWSGEVIDAIQMVYASASGSTVLTIHHGGSGGRLSVFRLDADEYITGISGRYGDVIDSLRIHTNKKTSPLYGGSGGSRDYRLEVPSGAEALGFAGRSAERVDAVGLVYAPLNLRLGGRPGGRVVGQTAQTQLYGGNGGYPFSAQDMPAGARIAEIRVSAGDRIESVQTVYVSADGRTVEGARHGGSAGRQRVFRLDPDEYVTGITGRYDTVVHSLQIRTNKKTSPLYGGPGGDSYFQVQVPAGSRAVGFAGRSGDQLDAIGLASAATSPDTGTYGQAVTAGYAQTQLYGGRGGYPFSAQDVPAGARIAEIRIVASDRVDSVQMIYDLPDGTTVEGQRYGGAGGRQRLFRLDSDETITGLSGTYSNRIDSLQIRTNKRTSPVYGGPGGIRSFQVDVPSGSRVVGFAGRSSDFVDAIGLTHTSMDARDARPRSQFGARAAGRTAAPLTLQTQVYGGGGGSPFSTQNVPAGARIAEIRVYASDRLDSVQVVYDLPDGSVVEGQRFGGSGGRQRIFRLDSDETLTGISGRYGSYVESLRIHTNKRISPLYGGTGGTGSFQVDVPNGSQAVGFVGRAGQYIDAIGLMHTRAGSGR